MASKKHPFWIVDVFAERRYAGNQLAVVLESDDIEPERMQEIAREMNFSETTFVSGSSERPVRVRIFTPAAEIPFAGHPTLGTAWVLRELAGASRPEEITLGLGVGPIRAWFDGDMVWMRQRAPELGAVHDSGEAAAAVGLSVDDLVPGLPCQSVDTGIPFLIVPVRNRAALARARPGEATAKATKRMRVEGIFTYCLEGHTADGDIAARMFAPEFQVMEDPATGSANGCLAAYLSHHRVLGNAHVEARVDQGHEMGRPSRLHIRARPEGDALAIEVGGRVEPVARGELL